MSGSFWGCGENAFTPRDDDPGPEGEDPPSRSAIVLPDTVDLVTLMDQLRVAMPGSGSNGYRPPSQEERVRFLDGIDFVRTLGNISLADSILDGLGYDVEVRVEATTGDSLVFFLERIPVEAGWGSYVLNRTTSSLADVHIDHPVFDLDTHLLGARVYLECDCRWLLVAGTHRNANAEDVSDMARSTTSIFQAVFERIAASSAQSMSIHGFAVDNYGPPIRDSHFVLSNGAGSDGVLGFSSTAQDLRDRLRDTGWVAGLVGDDDGYDQLTGAPNPQGRFANDRFGHGRWIHVEASRGMRSTEEIRRVVATALGRWLVEVF